MSSGDQPWPWKIHENPPFIGDFPFSAMVISHDYHRHRWFPRPLSTIDLALPRHGAWDSWRLNSGNEQKHIKIKDTSQNWWDSDRKKMNTWLTSETGDFAWTKQDFTEEWRQKNNIPESLGVPLTGYSAGILWMISGRYIWRHWFGCPWNSSGTPTAIAGDFVFGLQKWTPFHAQRLHLSPCLISKFRFKISKAHIQNILCVLIIAGNQPTFFFPRFLQTCAHIQKISRKEPTLRTGILIYI
jgi:hypothetical protein